MWHFSRCLALNVRLKAQCVHVNVPGFGTAVSLAPQIMLPERSAILHTHATFALREKERGKEAQIKTIGNSLRPAQQRAVFGARISHTEVVQVLKSAAPQSSIAGGTQEMHTFRRGGRSDAKSGIVKAPSAQAIPP